MPDVSLGTSKVGVTSIDLSSIIEAIQGYLLSDDSEGNFFTDPESISSCMELLETFSDRALQSDYNPWESVDAHGYEKIRAELEKSFKAVRVASDVESSSSWSDTVFVSEKLPEQRHRPAKRDIGNFPLILEKLTIAVWLICWRVNCDRSVRPLMQSLLSF